MSQYPNGDNSSVKLVDSQIDLVRLRAIDGVGMPSTGITPSPLGVHKSAESHLSAYRPPLGLHLQLLIKSHNLNKIEPLANERMFAVGITR